MAYNQQKLHCHKEKYTFEQRLQEFEKMKKSYPDRIFIIIEKVQNSDVPQATQKKFIVPPDLTISKFLFIFRKHCKLQPQKALFIFVDNILPPNSALISEIYNDHMDDDGFLYFTYSGESTFG